MAPVTRLFSRVWYRSRGFWLLLLVALYSLTGFVLAPWWLAQQLPQWVADHTPWQARVGVIRFNPYTLALSVDDFSLHTEQTQWLGWQHFHAHPRLGALLTGELYFTDIELRKPRVHLAIDAKGRLEIQQGFAAPSTEARADETAPATDMPRLFIEQLQVIDGQFSLADASQGEPLALRVAPIDFRLRDFSTFHEREGEYQLSLSLGAGEQVTWRGSVQNTPWGSRGRVELQGLEVARFDPYLRAHLPYRLRSGSLDLATDYRVRWQQGELALELDQGLASISEVQLSTNDDIQVLALKRAQVGPLTLSLPAMKTQIAEVSLEGLALFATRNAQGQLLQLAPLQAVTAAGTAPVTPSAPPVTPSAPPASPAAPFQWQLDALRLTDASLQWRDEVPAVPVEMRVSGIELHLRDLNEQLSRRSPFGLAWHSPVPKDSGQEAQQSQIEGFIQPQPLDLSASVNLTGLYLPLLQPYLSALTPLDLLKGEARLAGELQLRLPPAPTPKADVTPQGHFKGGLKFVDVAVGDGLLHQPLLGWGELALEPLQLNLESGEVTISLMHVKDYWAHLRINEDRSLQLARLASAPADTAANPDTDTKPDTTAVAGSQPSTEAPAAAPGLVLERLHLENGTLELTDRSHQPAFSLGLTELTGDLRALDLRQPRTATLALEGKVENNGRLRLDGEFNPLDASAPRRLNLSLDNVDLASFTPYSGRYVGYAIDKGKLQVKLDYQIHERELDAANHLVLKQLELGSPVSSNEAVDIPLKLGLTVLKDMNGVVDLDVPVKGHLDDPQFRLGKVIWGTLNNLIIKSATAPFTLLASLVPGADKLDAVAFAPGAGDLAQAQVRVLADLATALKRKPELLLEVRPGVAPQVDGAALVAAQPALTLDDLVWRNLARQRAKAITDYLTFEQGIAGERISVLNPDQNAPVDSGGVASRFSIRIN